MDRSATEALHWTMVALAFGVAAWLSPRLPELVPTHWDVHGNVNGYLRKPFGVYILPVTMVALHALFSWLPRASPHGFEIAPFARVYRVFHTTLLAFFLFITVLALRAATGERVPIAQGSSIALGLLLIVIGNFLGKITRNFFVGIRTPWTLANDEVWRLTHRLGGKVFVAAGVLMVLGVWAGANLGQCAAVAVLAALVPAAYSYIAYRRLTDRPH